VLHENIKSANYAIFITVITLRIADFVKRKEKFDISLTVHHELIIY